MPKNSSPPILCYFSILWCLFCGPVLGATLTVETDFEDGFGPWEALAEGRWELQDMGGNTAAALVEEGRDRPPVRRPRAYILLTSYAFSDFVFTARVESLEPSSLVGRDVVVIFGYVDDTHYYYTHLSNDSNGTSHNIIMKVSGSTRSTIHKENRPEPRLSDGWHEVKVTRDKEGNIAVFIDDLETPLMTATDTDYPLGTVGIGAFDDRARFDDLRITGSPPEPLAIEPPTAEKASALQYTVYEGIPFTIESSTNLESWSPLFNRITTFFTAPQSYELPATIDLPHFYRLAYTFPTLANE